jgi:Flp pilus assembly protein TadG
MKTIRSLLRDSSGSTLIAFATTLPMLLAGSGAALMYGFQVMTASDMQAALDSGTLAGTAMSGSATAALRIANAGSAYDWNFKTAAGNVETASNFWVQSGGDPTFTANKWEVSGTASAKIRNPFSFVIGDRWLPVVARSTATKLESDPVCLLALNASADDAIEMRGQPKIAVKDCAAQANSNSDEAISQTSKALMSASMIGSSGGYTGTGYDPTPMTGTLPLDDPYAEVPFPSSSPCDYNNMEIASKTVTLSPGVYCGGLTVKAGARVHLEPGIYVMKDGPLWLNSDGGLDGQEVTIGFTGAGASIRMDGSAQASLTSPVSGTYMNMQFMQEPGTGGDDLAVSITGNNTLSYDGAMYFPTQDIKLGGGSIITANSPNYAMVADRILVQDQSVVTVTHKNSRDLPIADAGSFMYGARLIR